MKTVEAVRGRWPEIFKSFGLPPVTGKKHFPGECPICGRKGKYRCDDKDRSGSWICSCGAGDGWKLLELTQRKDFKTLAKEIDQLIGNSYDRTRERTPPPEIQNTRSKVISKFSSLHPIRETSAQQYLASRGIHELPSTHIRFNADEKTPWGNKQAIWSVATDDKGAACYLHRTILDGPRKAGITGSKRMLKLQEESYLGFAGSVAIRMFPASSTLGVAEGIETALSCKQIYGCNTWSTLNAGFLRKFRAPEGVKHLIIFADSDSNGAGLSAAFECGHRNILHNNDVEVVSIRWPERGDFNDMLLNGAKVYQQQLSKSEAA